MQWLKLGIATIAVPNSIEADQITASVQSLAITNSTLVSVVRRWNFFARSGWLCDVRKPRPSKDKDKHEHG